MNTTLEAFGDLARLYPDKIISASISCDNFGGRFGETWSLTVFVDEDSPVSADGQTYVKALAALAKKIEGYDPAASLRNEAARLGYTLVPTEK